MEHEQGRSATTPTSCCGGRSSTPRRRPRSPCGSAASPSPRPDRRLPRPRATSGRSRPTSPTAARGAGSAVGADELLRVPCDLDLGDAEDREEAERAVRRAGRARCATRCVAADTVLTIWREPLEELVADARRASTARSSSRSGCPAHRLHAGRARRARAPADRRAGVRRAPAGRGPAADGHRLRPAGRRARLPAARRPRALPGGLPRARRRARAPSWPSSSSTRRPSVRRFLELTGEDFAQAG